MFKKYQQMMLKNKRILHEIIKWSVLIVLLPFILSKLIPKEFLGIFATVCFLILISYFTYEKASKEKKGSAVIIIIAITFVSLWVNHSAMPLFAPTIGNFDVEDSYIQSMYKLKSSFTLAPTENYKNIIEERDYYLTQKAKCNIKYPLLPIVNYVIVPLKESAELFPTTSKGEFVGYEINPFFNNVAIVRNKIYIEIKRLSSLLLQESSIDLIYRRKISKKLDFPTSFVLTTGENNEFILDICLQNKYPFAVKNLTFYLLEDFAKKHDLVEFFNSNSYNVKSIGYLNKSSGTALADNNGNVIIMSYVPVEAGGNMHFFLMFERK